MSSPDIGVAYMAAFLRSLGHSVSVLDYTVTEFAPAEFRELLRMKRPGVAGFPALTARVHDAASMAEEVKNTLPETLTVVGGPHPSALPERTLREFPSFDIAVSGEGEETIAEIAAGLENAHDFSNVMGMAWRPEGGISLNPPRPRIRDLDVLPFPAFDLFPLERYLAFYTRDRSLRELPISTARGCPFGCVFCSKVMGKKIVSRSIGNVIEEIRRGIERFGAKQFVMTDESFTLNRKRTSEFCESMIAGGLNEKARWIIHSRVDIEEDIFQEMRKAGCTHITFGIESGNQGILDRNKKGITLEQAAAAVRAAREAGLVTDGNFIMGLPYEDVRTVRDTIRFAIRTNPDYVSFFLFVPYPGTEAMSLTRAGEANLRLLSEDWRDYGKQVGGAAELATMSRRKLEAYQFIGYLLFYLRPGKIRLLFKKVDVKTAAVYMLFQIRKSFGLFGSAGWKRRSARGGVKL